MFTCQEQSASLPFTYYFHYSVPLRTQCIRFVFDGNAPLNSPKCFYVCSNNLTADFFLNEGQFSARFVIKLKLKDRFVPIVRDPAALPEEVSLTFYIFFMIICQSPLLWNVMLCYVMLCYVMLCYVMLCYVMLCYVIFCYILQIVAITGINYILEHFRIY